MANRFHPCIVSKILLRKLQPQGRMPGTHKDTYRNSQHTTLTSRAHAISSQDKEAVALKVRIRNGVETIPSMLRRKYHVDDMPVRGKLKTKIRFGFKMLALNFSKLWLYTRGLEKCKAYE